MKYWAEYKNHVPEIVGKRKKIDNTIYTFDIETTSYLLLDNKQLNASNYLKLSKEDREKCEFRSTMYIWQFSINDTVYYGRTWEELTFFLDKLEENVKYRKIVFVHNLAFEFQFLKSNFHFTDVMARKSHKIMTGIFKNYNIMIKCSYMMSNCALKYLPDLYNLPVQKLVGDLDYNPIRHSDTPLTEKELGYCEQDCLVVYHYILYELATYERVDKIPTTSTGHVRRELQNLVLKDYSYKRKVRKSINVNPLVFNRLQECFMGGYTHANWIYSDEVLKDIDSYDETSAYPYVLVTRKFPSTEFKKGNIKSVSDMIKDFAYIVVVKFKNISCKYYNNFISASKCRNISKAKYDNGRIMEAEELEMTLTDIDFKFILDSYNCKYEILESWWSLYNYLPKQYLNFTLDKYVEKTKYKGVSGKELDYAKSKGLFNSIYGMTVTNEIRDNVFYKDEIESWIEEELTNEEIENKLEAQKKKAFLSFSTGVWCTAYARDNLLRRVIELDEFVVYCDTDSCKVLPGYNKKIFEDYNKSVEEKIKFVSKVLKIPIEKYAPTDIKGKPHMLGLFEYEEKYQEFITQGAKKYAVKVDDKIEITVAGVPKCGAKALKSLEEFKDDFVFSFEDTGKNLLIYVEDQEEFELVDYLGNKKIVKDKSGCCIVPTTYVLGKALDYATLLTSNSSKRSIYKEEKEVKI